MSLYPQTYVNEECWRINQRGNFEEDLAKRLAKVIPRKDEPKHLHHIVAQTAEKAGLARFILEKLLPGGVNNPLNLVYVKASVHQRLHTTWYYNMINISIYDAYVAGGMDKNAQISNVVAALLFWKAYIYSLNELSV